MILCIHAYSLALETALFDFLYFLQSSMAFNYVCACVCFFSLMKIFIEIYGKKAEKSHRRGSKKKMVHGQKDRRKVLNNANLVNCLSKWWACVHKTHMRCRHTMRFHRSHHDKIKAQMRFIQVHCVCVCICYSVCNIICSQQFPLFRHFFLSPFIHYITAVIPHKVHTVLHPINSQNY